jgi:hypothetical protein
MPPTILDKLLDTLQQERKAAIEADFGALAEIGRFKEKQFLKLRLGDDGGSVLRQIKDEVSQNQVLIAAVLDGVKAARGHINGVKSTKGVVNVYNETGGIETFNDPSSRKSHKY